jgi:hypothetical protein
VLLFCLGVVALVAFVFGAYALIGWGLSWVLGYFGLVVPWYVHDGVAWFLALILARAMRGGGAS